MGRGLTKLQTATLLSFDETSEKKTWQHMDSTRPVLVVNTNLVCSYLRSIKTALYRL